MAFLLHRNGLYAERHGYEHMFVQKAAYDLPVYWQKVAMARRLMEAGYDAALWLDTDAVVHDLDRPLDALFEADEAMVAAGDNPFWSSPFNAGVFAVRAADGHGLSLTGRWLDLFRGTRWTRTPTAWECQEEWAGPDFEQGAFVAHLLADATASGELRLADWRLLQSPFPVEGAFALHFAGPFKANLPAYVQLI